MSAPSQELRHAKYLDYAFLAAKSEKAVLGLIDRTTLSEEDRKVLNEASNFLQQVATGARALTSGNYQVRNFTAAMEALEFAMDPLEELSNALMNRDIAQVLSETAQVIFSKIAEHPIQPLNALELEDVKLFRSFFDLFYKFILEKVDQMNRVGVLGTSIRVENAGLVTA